MEAAPFIKNDARLQTWGELYRDAIGTLQDEEKNSATSRGQLVQRVS
jgi:hypothetical protein